MDVKIVVGTVFTKFRNLSSYERRLVDKCTSYFQEGSQFTKAFRVGGWNGYVHLLSYKDMLPTGMLNVVIKKFSKKNVKYKIYDRRKYFNIPKLPSSLTFGSKLLRPYQVKALNKIFENHVGIINIPTGTGKSLIIGSLASVINNRKVGIIASGTSLLLQLKRDIKAITGEKIGYIGEGVWEEKRITIISVDTLSDMLLPPPKKVKFKNKLKKLKYLNRIARWKKSCPIAKDFLSKLEVICLDEAHHGPARTFKAVLYSCVNALVRVGFTATYKRSDGNDVLLHAVTGGVIYKKSTSWMIKHGYLAKPIIVLLPYDEDIEYENYVSAYADGIVGNVGRNSFIAESINALYKYGLSAVLFVREKVHGKIIEDMLINSCGIDSSVVVFATGNESGSMRRRILKGFRMGKIRILLCTRIFNEGIDFPEGNAGIKADGFKFEGTQIQQMGRLLRKVPVSSGEIDRDRDEEVFFVDILDMHDIYLAKHSLKRMTAYEKEEGFVVKIAKNSIEFENIIGKHIDKVILVDEKVSCNS